MKDINKLVENYFNSPNNKLETSSFLELIKETIEEVKRPQKRPEGLLEAEGRFSYTIPLPKFQPSEAWGDPDSQDRKEVDKIFRVITGGQDMRARIDSINKFLDPASAKRKKSPSVIINMMMIVEALQATLNDYNESAAGFVFEGFMAALTGGKQIAGKVGGTLPIEDFVAFSSFGADLPVSLKLLSGTTPVKGSFTNIVDFLLVRGAPAIKYLVAYKAVSGKGKVEKLNLFAFDITRENFIDFISNISGGDTLLSPHGSKKLKIAMAEFNKSNDLASVAQLVVQLAGYNKSGLLHNYVKTGALPSDPTPE